MKILLMVCVGSALCCSGLLGANSPAERGTDQFIHLTAAIETTEWHTLDADRPLSVRLATWTAQCVVGSNCWQIVEHGFGHYAEHTYWFTGSNLIRYAISRKPVSDRKELYERNHGPMPAAGGLTTSVVESEDGNPGRPGRVADLMQYPANICWLAFCSGPVLKRERLQLFPVYDLWKNYVLAPFGFPYQLTMFVDELGLSASEQATLFGGDLGLPSGVTICTTNCQPILQYRATASTNILGWSLPLEFSLVQYNPAGTNGWVLCLTAKGKVTAIWSGSGPESPIGKETTIDK